jgi:hypothetical protein
VGASGGSGRGYIGSPPPCPLSPVSSPPSSSSLAPGIA